jgi:hypothetical protein
MVTAKENEKFESKLRELGFDPAAAPEEAIAALRSLRAAAGEATIAHALGAIATPESAAMLAEMEAGTTGAVRREIRRALFRLRQRGITPAEKAVPVPATVVESEAGLSALLSPADSQGASIAWLIKARAGGGLKRLWGLVSENEGLLGVTIETLSRKDLRKEQTEVERRAGAKLVDAQWQLVDFIMCDAYRRTPEARRGRVGNFLTLRTEIIAASPATEFVHPIYGEFAKAVAEEPSADLLKEPEIAAFKLAPTVIKPFADEASGLQQSVIVLSQVQQGERVNTVVERALAELIVGDNAYRLRRHLEDTAYFFARTGMRPQAGWATAAAAKIRDGADLKRSPFFQTFMRMQLGAIVAEQQEQARQETRLIMTPAEAMRARQAAQSRMRRRSQ